MSFGGEILKGGEVVKARLPPKLIGPVFENASSFAGSCADSDGQLGASLFRSLLHPVGF